MMKRLLTFAVLVLSAELLAADRINQIYEKLQKTTPCFRKMNGTGQFGCGSSLSGDVGVVHLVDDKASLDWVVRKGTHSPYVALLYPDHMNKDWMNQLKGSGRVSGIMVLKDNDREDKLKKFSPELTCPNQGFGLYTNNSDSHFCEPWNSAGEDLLFERFDFPIFYVTNETESKSVLDCYYKFNYPGVGENMTARDWPLCAAQMKSFMLAAVDTPTCIRRSERFSMEPQRVCDPMGDHNLWAPLIPSSQGNGSKSKSVIVIAARLDSASLFEGRAHGADSAATGVVALLSVIKHLSQYKDYLSDSSIDNIYFMMFHGEAFGYIGSSRIVYDMKKDNFPNGIDKDDENATSKLNLDDVKYFIEIGQVGLVDKNQPYWIHVTEGDEASQLASNLKSAGEQVSLTFKTSESKRGLPPCSMQSFVKEKKKLSGAYIGNYDSTFTNQFYHSMFDDAARLNYTYGNGSLTNVSTVTTELAKLAASISVAVLNLVGSRSISITPNISEVDELLYCYLKTDTCPLFQRITGRELSRSDVLNEHPLDFYVGVSRHYIPSTQYTQMLMMYYQGKPLPQISKQDDCKTPEGLRNATYQWINGTCLETTVNVSEAVSPAFIIDNYDWSSNQYSTWTESVWQPFMVRIFLKPSLAHEIATLISGILVAIISFVVVGWISSKSDLIFPSRSSGMAC